MNDQFFKISSINILLLIIRISLGLTFLLGAFAKIGFINKITDLFIQLKVPYPLYFTLQLISLEMFAGILLILGMANRLLASIYLVFLLFVYFNAKTNAFFTSIYNEEISYIFFLVSLILLVMGPGSLTYKYFFNKR